MGKDFEVKNDITANASMAKEMDEHLNSIREIEDMHAAEMEQRNVPGEYCDAPFDANQSIEGRLQEMHPDYTFSMPNTDSGYDLNSGNSEELAEPQIADTPTDIDISE